MSSTATWPVESAWICISTECTFLTVSVAPRVVVHCCHNGDIVFLRQLLVTYVYLFLWLFIFNLNSRTEQTPGRILTLNGSKDTARMQDCAFSRSENEKLKSNHICRQMSKFDPKLDLEISA